MVARASVALRSNAEVAAASADRPIPVLVRVVAAKASVAHPTNVQEVAANAVLLMSVQETDYANDIKTTFDSSKI